MKQRKSFLTLSIVGVMILAFCLAGTAIGGPGPNSGSVPVGYKTMGPSPKAFLMVGWRPNLDALGETGFGILEAYIWVGDKLYIGIIDDQHPENLMVGASANDLIVKFDINGILKESWLFPVAIAHDYKVMESDTVVVLENKDISAFETLTDIEGGEFGDLAVDVSGGTIPLGFKHLFRCNLRLSFLVPE